MSVRAVWIINVIDQDLPKLLFSRYFPTVEKRAKLCQGPRYVVASKPPNFLQDFISALGIDQPKDEFVTSRDSCFVKKDKPIYEVETENGKLWPVVVLPQGGLFFVALPLIEVQFQDDARPPLAKLTEVTACLSLLFALAEFLGPTAKHLKDNSQGIADLYVFLGQAAPFGTMSDTNPATVRAALGIKENLVFTDKQPQPAWRPDSVRVKQQQIALQLDESIKAIQYGKPGLRDVWQLYGQLECRQADVAPSVEVALTLSWQDDKAAIPIDHLLLSEAVHMADANVAIPDLVSGAVWDANLTPRRITFHPPVDPFTLCHYRCLALPQLPLAGTYEMEDGETAVTIEASLQLGDRVKNSFEYCEVHFPFYNRGSILDTKLDASKGTTVISANGKTVVWNIGDQFPSKSRKVSLTGTVNFEKTDVPSPNGQSTIDEQFCIGQNSFMLVNFKITDYTLTNIHVDIKSVQTSPRIKMKTALGRSFLSSEYRIWNSRGDAIMPFSPPDNFFT